MDWDFINGVLAGMFAFQMGYWSGKRRARRNSVQKDLSKCSCTHEYSLHKPDGSCNVSIKTSEYNKYGDHIGYNWDKNCACVRYDGVPPAHIFMNYDKDNP